MRPTPASQQLGLLQLGESTERWWPEQLSDATAGWSLLQWAQQIDPSRLKPATQVLAYAEPDYGAGAEDELMPLVMSMRYGAGRVLYVATDETWRWRYGRGERLPERFWLQMIRLLGRESLARSGKSATLEISPRRADVDQPVRVEVELLDQQIVAEKLPSIVVRLRRQGAGENAASGSEVELILKPTGDGYETYSTLWLPSAAGKWVAEVADSALIGLNLEGEVVVSLPDDELRHPETDHPLLAKLSEDTGGRIIRASELSTLPEQIPNRRRLLLNEATEALWDTPLALILVVGLLTIEWVVRRVIRLV